MSNPTPGSDPNQPYGAAPEPGYGPPPYGQPPSGPPGYGGGRPDALPMTPFQDAVRSVLTQYATFTGRARRSEYWWFALASFLASAVAAVIDEVLGFALLQTVVMLGLLVPTLAVGARRLHDTGKSGWWQLIGIVPLVGWIVLIVLFAQDSHPNPNQHGPSPKYQAAGGWTGH